VHKAAVKLGTAVPDDEAQTWLGARTGGGLGRERMHTVTNHRAEGVTVLDVVPPRPEIAPRMAAVSAGRSRRPVLVRGSDGAYGPPRPDRARKPCAGPRRKRAKRARGRGPWRAAKGFRGSLLAGERISHGRSWHQGHNEEPRGEALKQVKEAGVIPAEPGRLCVVCDGAEWRGQHVQALLPQARQVLDSSHCAQSLPRVATAHYGASVQA
jgi:hypothetical protein